MILLEEKNNKIYTLPTKEIELFSGIEQKMLYLLAKRPLYPKEIARKLGVHEQKIYYHIRNLEKNGIIKNISKEVHGGIIAKLYSLTKPSFFVKFKEMEIAKKIPKNDCEFLIPFISDNKFNAKIVVGSPDPHGPERARSRDISYAIDLAIFLGTFLTDFNNSCIKLDTELHPHDLKENLILIGGPVTNKITMMINSKMPIRFDEKRNIYSSISKKTYKNDECGLIIKMTNPFDKEKKILVIAGKRFSGTRAAILAFLQKFNEISKNASVVEGLDNDYDGIIDSVRVLE
ncbi:MAG: S-layer protein [Candidatus Aenigmatarchaeota archaeon]